MSTSENDLSQKSFFVSTFLGKYNVKIEFLEKCTISRIIRQEKCEKLFNIRQEKCNIVLKRG